MSRELWAKCSSLNIIYLNRKENVTGDLKTKGKRQRTKGLSISPLSFIGRSGEAVGLSAISFSAALQKDAAPIPNALGLPDFLYTHSRDRIDSAVQYSDLRPCIGHNLNHHNALPTLRPLLHSCAQADY